jgi:hypothetical protein
MAKTSGGLRFDEPSVAVHVTRVVPTGNSVGGMAAGKDVALTSVAVAPPGPSGAVQVTVAAPLLSTAESVKRVEKVTTLEDAPRAA